MQEQYIIQVHFLYGSKPHPQFKHQEKKWFGGYMGGHAGIALKDNELFSFFKKGSLHIFQKNSNKHGHYIITSKDYFYTYLGGTFDTNQRVEIHIPVDKSCYKKAEKLIEVYLQNTPYDYAFFGYRCAAATYENLAQLGIVPQLGYWHTALKIFYPKILRRIILKLAKQNNWKTIFNAGRKSRIWEKDN